MKYHISDVVSVATGKMLSINGYSALVEFYNYLIQDSLYRHQLSRAALAAKEYILTAYPKLAQVRHEGITQDNCAEYFEEWAKVYGEYLDVLPMPEGAFEHIDPIQELIHQIGNKENVIIVVEDDKANV